MKVLMTKIIPASMLMLAFNVTAVNAQDENKQL